MFAWNPTTGRQMMVSAGLSSGKEFLTTLSRVSRLVREGKSLQEHGEEAFTARATTAKAGPTAIRMKKDIEIG